MAKSGQKPPGVVVFAKNRKAFHDYQVLERFEAGLSLLGSEVKSIRDGKISLKEAYGQIIDHEAYLVGAHIAEYEMAHARNHDPVRRRKLLLSRRELDRLEKAVTREGLTLVPLSVYAKKGRIKLEIGIGRGKKVRDRRADIKEREQRREMRRALKERN